MKSRNPFAGIHASGAPIAKSGVRPPARTGSPSGFFVGTGVNRKTAAKPEMRPSRSSPAMLSGRQQLEQFNRQAPEPFRNPARGANLGGVPSDRIQGNPGRVSKPMSQAEMNLATGHAANYSEGFARGNVRVHYSGQPALWEFSRCV
jgi:hypothetical protein